MWWLVLMTNASGSEIPQETNLKTHYLVRNYLVCGLPVKNYTDWIID